MQHSQDSDREIDPLAPLDRYAALRRGFRRQVDENFNIAGVCCSRRSRAAKGSHGAIKIIAIRAHQTRARALFHT